MGPRRGTSTSLLYLLKCYNNTMKEGCCRVLKCGPVVEIGVDEGCEGEGGYEAEDDGDEDCHGADEVKNEEEGG